MFNFSSQILQHLISITFHTFLALHVSSPSCHHLEPDLSLLPTQVLPIPPHLPNAALWTAEKKLSPRPQFLSGTGKPFWKTITYPLKQDHIFMSQTQMLLLCEKQFFPSLGRFSHMWWKREVPGQQCGYKHLLVNNITTITWSISQLCQPCCFPGACFSSEFWLLSWKKSIINKLKHLCDKWTLRNYVNSISETVALIKLI